MFCHNPFFLSVLLIASCTGTNDANKVLKEGIWRVEMELNGPISPFIAEIEMIGEDDRRMVIRNAAEEIVVNDVEVRNDSIFIRMPHYDTEFRGAIRSSEMISGQWTDHTKGANYRIPFTAVAGATDRFPLGTVQGDISGSWETHFNEGDPKGYNAIGVFEQDTEGHTTGTFMTETGDYRYLEGVVDGDSLKLSSFDGARSLLFKAEILGDSMTGRFWSGTHWEEPWYAVRDPEYTLRDPDSLTFLKEGYTKADFEFPDLEGTMVSTTDDRFKNKPLVIQVMGSWCPNCIDETRFLNELHSTYNSRGLEVIAIAFEKHKDQAKAINALKRFRDALDVEYPILYAGLASKEVAAEKLPFLDHVMSYPTTIYVDRNGSVRRIRTGYYGPGTGEQHTIHRKQVETLVEQLIEEDAAVTKIP